MSRKISILVVVCALFYDSHAFAWSWKDAVDQAMSQNPSLNSKRQGMEQFRLRYENAKSLRYPTLNVVGQYVEYQDQTRHFRHRAYLGPELQILLYQGGKVRAGIDRADAENDQATLSSQVESIGLQEKLREAFANAIYAKNYLQLAHRIQQRREDNMKLTKVRYESGLEYQWVFLSYNAKLQQSQLDVQEAEMNKKTALSDLEVVLDKLPISTVEEIQEDGFYTTDAIVDLDQITANLEKNPKYLLQQSKLEEAKSNVEIAKADYYPQIALQGDLWAASVETNNLFPAWYAGGVLRMPLFQGGRVRRNVGIAKAQLSGNLYDLAQTRLDLKTTLQKTYKTYQITKQQVEVAKQKLEAAKTRAKVVAQQYRSGLATFLDWDTSQDGWVNSEIDLLNSIKNYQISRGKLEEAMGMELGQ